MENFTEAAPPAGREAIVCAFRPPFTVMDSRLGSTTFTFRHSTWLLLRTLSVSSNCLPSRMSLSLTEYPSSSKPGLACGCSGSGSASETTHSVTVFWP